MSRFEGRTVLGTGAASGIGRATAERLAGEGAAVVGVDLASPDDPPAGAAGFVGGDVRDEGGRARAGAARRAAGAGLVAGAVRDEEPMPAPVPAAVPAGGTGRLDGVVHAAGVAG